MPSTGQDHTSAAQVGTGQSGFAAGFWQCISHLKNFQDAQEPEGKGRALYCLPSKYLERSSGVFFPLLSAFCMERDLFEQAPASCLHGEVGLRARVLRTVRKL